MHSDRAAHGSLPKPAREPRLEALEDSAIHLRGPWPFCARFNAMASQCFGRDGRAGRLMHLVEFAPRMGPARRQLDIAAGTQPLEPGVTVDLNDSSEPRQMRGGTLGAAIGTVEIDGRRRIGSVPGPVIAGVDPKP